MTAWTMVSAPVPRLQLPPAAPPAEFYRQLTNRVRRIRIELGLRSYDAARAAGMSSSNYCKFETGKRQISAEQFFKIQQYFG